MLAAHLANLMATHRCEDTLEKLRKMEVKLLKNDSSSILKTDFNLFRKIESFITVPGAETLKRMVGV